MTTAMITTTLAPPAGAATQSILNTYAGGLPKNFFGLNGIKRVVCDIAHSHDFTYNWYWSADGATWNQIDTQAAPFVAGETSIMDILVEPYGDVYWKLEVLNGATLQTTWAVRLALSTDRATAVALSA